MKICFIAQFPPPIHGLSKAVDTLYASEKNYGDGKYFFRKIDITNNKRFISNLFKIMRTRDDLFYFTISQTKGGNLRDLVVLKLLSIQKKHCLIHLHGGYYRELVEKGMSGWQRKANYRAIKKIDGAIVLSQSLKSIFKGMINDDKIFVVMNCVDDEYLITDEEINDKLSIKDTDIPVHFLWLSNFIKTKGYREVLELAKLEHDRILSGGNKKFHFDFAGKFFDKEEEDYFNDFIACNGLSKLVTYHGVVAGEQKRELLKKCLIFALPTRYPNEGQPISILEAMGNGMYIISTDHAGIPDIVQDGINGILIKKDRSINEVYNQLLECDMDNIINVCKHNREYCKEKFSEKHYIESCYACFDKVRGED